MALKVVGLAGPDLEAEEVANLMAEPRFLRNLDCPYIVKCYEAGSNEDWYGSGAAAQQRRACGHAACGGMESLPVPQGGRLEKGKCFGGAAAGAY